ncbi:MAG: hypothetical protein WC371_02345, partial [Parachlamydiales bacterium]
QDSFKKTRQLFSLESQLQKKFWRPLFDWGRLSAAFEHHDGTLKRTKLLKNNQSCNFGTLYLGDGALAPSNQLWPIQAYLSQHFAKALGKVQFFWLVEVFEDQVIYQAISETGEILDGFTQQIKL